MEFAAEAHFAGLGHALRPMELAGADQPQPAAVERPDDLEVGRGLVVAGVRLDRAVARPQIAEVLGRAADQPAGLAGMAVELEPAAQRAVGRACPDRRPRRHAGHGPRRPRLDRHHATERVAAVEDGSGPAQHFDPLNEPRVDRVQVLVRTGAVERVVEPDAVDRQHHLFAGQSPKKRRAAAGVGLLDKDTGRAGDDVGKLVPAGSGDLIAVDHGQRARSQPQVTGVSGRADDQLGQGRRLAPRCGRRWGCGSRRGRHRRGLGGAGGGRHRVDAAGDDGGRRRRRTGGTGWRFGKGVPGDGNGNGDGDPVESQDDLIFRERDKPTMPRCLFQTNGCSTGRAACGRMTAVGHSRR